MATGISARERAGAGPELGAKRLGILGGTFNPPHEGHIALARQALSELGLERVLLMPVHTPPHKPAPASDPGPQRRLEMCELAAAEVEGVEASALEVERGGRSYTVDTLEAIDERNPEASLTLLMGADMARTLPSWRSPQRVLELASVAVAQRPGTDRAEVLEALESLHPAPGRVRFLAMAPVEVSSTAIRAGLRRGGCPAGGLQPAVAAYIERHALYGALAAGAR